MNLSEKSVEIVLSIVGGVFVSVVWLAKNFSTKLCKIDEVSKQIENRLEVSLKKYANDQIDIILSSKFEEIGFINLMKDVGEIKLFVKNQNERLDFICDCVLNLKPKI